MTKVKFLIEKPEGNLPCNVFAFFPEMHNYGSTHPDYKEMFICYGHIGQHSACHIDYANECKEANYNEYSDLLKELIAQGYKDLQVMNKQTIEAHREPTQGEIKFGEGATHWLTVALSCILNKKGNIKKWFIYPKDGLRYYTN